MSHTLNKDGESARMAVLPFISSCRPIPRRPGSSADVGPFVNVVTWTLLITSALAVLTRLVTKRALQRRIDVDDAFVMLALVRCHRCIFSFVDLAHSTDNVCKLGLKHSIRWGSQSPNT